MCAVTALAVNNDNYCTDKEATNEWEELAVKNPEDLDLQRLHALRIGICLKIENGSLTLEQGITIFEQDRQRLIRKRNEEERARPKTSFQ